MTTRTRGAAGSAAQDLAADVGLQPEQLRDMYRLVALARATDERMWVLNRAGMVPFVISGQGHEGAQVGLCYDLRKGHDWLVPFYRSVAACITFGMSPRDIMTAQFARANDVSSGGRQMPGHYGAAIHNVLSTSSPVATQLLHAVGHRPGGADPRHRPGGADVAGGGVQQPGRLPRGPQLRRHPPPAGRLRGGEQRLRHQRADGPRVGRAGHRHAGRRLRHARRDRRRRGRAGLLPRGARGDRPRPSRRGADAHRGQGHAPDGPLVGRPADQVPQRRGARAGTGARSAAALPRAAPGRRRHGRRATGGTSRPRSR